MRRRPTAIALLALFAAQPAAAQQAEPDIQILASALDRCMATYAVRLTRTAASDREIFAQAIQGCGPLDARLRAALRTQLPPAEADEVLRTIDAQAEPNFMAILARIRSDRAAREGP
jgi:hypothetical protein